jgi:hypothetical protein
MPVIPMVLESLLAPARLFDWDGERFSAHILVTAALPPSLEVAVDPVWTAVASFADSPAERPYLWTEKVYNLLVCRLPFVVRADEHSANKPACTYLQSLDSKHL